MEVGALRRAQGEVAAGVVAATTLHASIMVAATSSAPPTNGGEGGSEGVDEMKSTERHEVENGVVKNSDSGGGGKTPLGDVEKTPQVEVLRDEQEIVMEDNCDGKQEYSTGVSVESRLAAALVAAATTTTAAVIACSSKKQTDTIDNSNDQSHVVEKVMNEVECNSIDGEISDIDDTSVTSHYTSERELAASVVLSTTSSTSIMLAAMSDITKKSVGEGSLNSCNQSFPESSSSVTSTLPPLPGDRFQNARDDSDEEDLPESSRQSATTHNKFIAMDIISHPSAWLFHLIDRNSDASLTISEFVVALADQPLVSMALNLPQQLKSRNGLEKVEKVFDCMDFNGSGTINMLKFLQYIDNTRKFEELKALHDAKKKLDAMRAQAQAYPLNNSSEKNSNAFEIDYIAVMKSSRRLNLTSRGIRDRDIVAISHELLDNNILRFLVLGRNNIELDGVCMLSKSLRSNVTLTRLDLGSNRFGNDGVIALANALQNNSTLKRLDLYNTPMNESGALAIANCLRVNKSLTELSLRGNHMGNNGASLIGEALRYNTVLTTLHLQENDIDPIPGMRNFVLSLYSCDNFVLERLEGINLSDFSQLLDISPNPTRLENTEILLKMRKRRGLHVSKRILNK